MAKASYAPMFETVSGALTRINKKSPHAADQKMILATHRTAPTTSKDCSRVYIRDLDSVTRSTDVKENELLARVRFATVAAAVNTRMHDVSKQAADKAAFLAQKDLPGGKKTLKSWYWMVELEAYDEQNQG